jgi:hypothetical protein
LVSLGLHREVRRDLRKIGGRLDLDGRTVFVYRRAIVLERGEPLSIRQDAGAVVDNFHAGGIGCPVDLDTGQLKVGTLEKTKRSNWLDAWSIREHPDTGVSFADRFVYPHFEAAKELCMRAHMLLGPDLMLCSWDVACTIEGPLLVEVGPAMGGALEVMHRPDVRLYRETLKHWIRSAAGEV